MRFLLVLLSVVCMAFAASEKEVDVRWYSYADGLKKAAKESKLMFVSLYADWCVPCRIMEKNVFPDPSVANLLNERFIPVRLNAESQDTITCDGLVKTVERCYFDVWNLSAVPSLVLVAPKGMSILTLTQSMDAEDMNYLLKQFLYKEKEWIAQ